MGLYKRKLHFIVRLKWKCKCKHKQIIKSMIKNPKHLHMYSSSLPETFPEKAEILKFYQIPPNNTCEAAQLRQSCRPRAQFQECLFPENTPSDFLRTYFYICL